MTCTNSAHTSVDYQSPAYQEKLHITPGGLGRSDPETKKLQNKTILSQLNSLQMFHVVFLACHNIRPMAESYLCIIASKE